MNIKISAPEASIGRTITRNTPYQLDTEAQLPVGLALVNIYTPPFGTIDRSVRIYLINRSLGGQIIRVGLAPGFAPAMGLSLMVGDAQMYDNVWNVFNAIADGAGALLDVQIFNQF